MSEIKLFVTHTPNRNTVRIEHPLMYNVIAGSAFLTQSVPEGMLLDNEGDNISFKNKSYCELTTQYWAVEKSNCRLLWFLPLPQIFFLFQSESAGS